MILGLRRPDQKKALNYGLVGAFAFRITATLLATYLNSIGVVHFEVKKGLSFGLIAVIFGVAHLIARRKGPVLDEDDMSDEAEQLLSS